SRPPIIDVAVVRPRRALPTRAVSDFRFRAAGVSGFYTTHVVAHGSRGAQTSSPSGAPRYFRSPPSLLEAAGSRRPCRAHGDQRLDVRAIKSERGQDFEAAQLPLPRQPVDGDLI